MDPIIITSEDMPSVDVKVKIDASTSSPPRMRKPCGPKCRRRCTETIPEERRRDIWRSYWNMSYSQKRLWMYRTVTQLPIRKMTVLDKNSRRCRSFMYMLQDLNGVPKQVCKLFFLSTLGYHPKNDRLVITMMGHSNTIHLSPPKDQRGRHTPANKLNMEPLNEHVESFNPSFSYYKRLKQVSNIVRYLPSDVNIKLMYEDFCERSNICCSYESYRKAVKEKNISFAKVGEEERCEDCLLQDQHFKGGHLADCRQCHKFHEHIQSALECESHYQADVDKDWPEDTSVRRLDLQRVTLLPRMPGVRKSIFTKRLAVFYETFASIGKNNKTVSVVWHEGIAERSAEEIASAFVTALERDRSRHSIFWVESCTAQNKNWCLLSSLVCLVNNSAREDITFKYFERGHLKIDSHHSIEQQIKSHGAVLDLQDFMSVVGSCSNSVAELKNVGVRMWRDGHSSAKIKKAHKLSEMVVIMVRRGSRSLFYKLFHKDDHFTELDFLQDKFEVKLPTSALRPQDKGIEEVKKRDIIENLCPLMPPDKRDFWCSLTVNNATVQ